MLVLESIFIRALWIGDKMFVSYMRVATEHSWENLIFYPFLWVLRDGDQDPECATRFLSRGRGQPIDRGQDKEAIPVWDQEKDLSPCLVINHDTDKVLGIPLPQ